MGRVLPLRQHRRRILFVCYIFAISEFQHLAFSLAFLFPAISIIVMTIKIQNACDKRMIAVKASESLRSSALNPSVNVSNKINRTLFFLLCSKSANR